MRTNSKVTVFHLKVLEYISFTIIFLVFSGNVLIQDKKNISEKTIEKSPSI